MLHVIEFSWGKIKLDIPESVHPVFPSSKHLADLIDVGSEDKVLDLGCGSGVLSMVAAKKGASMVISTDIDMLALKTTMYNAGANGCGEKIFTMCGSWFDPLKQIKFDVIMATPPQTPGPYNFGPRYGGEDGTMHLKNIIEEAPEYLDPKRGRLWLVVISLSDVKAIFEMLKKKFQMVAIVDETKRPFTPVEYENMCEGLFEYLLSQSRQGKSSFSKDSSGQYYFKTFFIRASNPVL